MEQKIIRHNIILFELILLKLFVCCSFYCKTTRTISGDYTMYPDLECNPLREAMVSLYLVKLYTRGLYHGSYVVLCT